MLPRRLAPALALALALAVLAPYAPCAARAAGQGQGLAVRGAVRRHGCAFRACFALDSSAALGAAGFRAQARFAGAVAAVAALDPRFRGAAAAYGARTRPLSRLTADLPAFVARVERARYAPSERTLLAPAIAFCGGELAGAPGEAADKMVLIGDGRANLLPGLSVALARQFRAQSGSAGICAVTVAHPDVRFWRAIAGDAGRVVQIDDYNRFFAVVDEVIMDVCELHGKI